MDVIWSNGAGVVLATMIDIIDSTIHRRPREGDSLSQDLKRLLDPDLHDDLLASVLFGKIQQYIIGPSYVVDDISEVLHAHIWSWQNYREAVGLRPVDVSIHAPRHPLEIPKAAFYRVFDLALDLASNRCEAIHIKAEAHESDLGFYLGAHLRLGDLTKQLESELIHSASLPSAIDARFRLLKFCCRALFRGNAVMLNSISRHFDLRFTIPRISKSCRSS
jgi:hypothetical protein